MIEEIRRKLFAEVEALNHELHVVLPQTLKKAIELGDLRENADYQAAIERQGMIQARLEQLRSRLHKLSAIDLSKVPRDRVGLGSRVTVVGLQQRSRRLGVGTWIMAIVAWLTVITGTYIVYLWYRTG